MKQRILGIPPHLSLILSLMLLIFYVTDRFNTAMAFINHSMTKDLIGVLVVFNLLSAVRLILLRGQRSKIARTVASIAWSLCSLATAIVLLVDAIYPARVLFTMESVKTLLLLLAVLSIVSSVLLIVCQRRAAAKSGENEPQTCQGKQV